MMRQTDRLQKRTGESAPTRAAFRVCLSVTGLGCASEGVTLERALRRIEGVADAAVNPLRNRVALEVDRLVRLPQILRVLGVRGYSIDAGEVRVTIWIGGVPDQLQEIAQRLRDFPGVSYCRLGTPTGRFDLAFTLEKGWEERVEDVCTWVCEVARDAANTGAGGQDGIEENGTDR